MSSGAILRYAIKDYGAIEVSSVRGKIVLRSILQPVEKTLEVERWDFHKGGQRWHRAAVSLSGSLASVWIASIWWGKRNTDTAIQGLRWFGLVITLRGTEAFSVLARSPWGGL